MRIRIRSDERRFTIVLPTRLIFSKTILKFSLEMGRKFEEKIPYIPPQAVDALPDEIRRIKRKNGSWEMVDVESADGEQIQIIL